MYKIQLPQETTLEVNAEYEGESIEEKIRRMIETGEPIGETSPIIYTERKEGVRPEYDIRTDMFDLAIDAMTVSSKGHLAKREERAKLGEEAKKAMEVEKKTEKPKEGPSTAQE